MPNIAFAERSPYIDPEMKEIEHAMNLEVKACKDKAKGVPKKLACLPKAQEKYSAKYVYRGTEEYCEKHYSKLNKKELEKLFDELLENSKQARKSRPINAYTDKAQEGELFETDFGVELRWLNNKLVAIQRQEVDEYLGKNK